MIDKRKESIGSDSGYWSNSSNNNRSVDILKKEKDQKNKEFFSKLLWNINFENPRLWRKYLSDFRENISNLESKFWKKAGELLGNDKISFEFSWKDIDRIIEEIPNPRIKSLRRDPAPAIALREIAKTDLVFDKELIQDIIKEYEHDYKIERTVLMKYRDCEGNNFLHCIAIAFSNKVAEGRSVSESEWDFFNDMCWNFHDLIDKNEVGRTPIDIIENQILVNETAEILIT